MPRFPATLAVAFALTSPAWGARSAHAQVVVETTTSTTAEVTVTGRVTTTSTQTVVVPDAVVVAPVEVAPAEASGGVVPLLVMRGELAVSAAYADLAAPGATALFGLDAGGGWGGGLIVGYASPLSIDDAPSELHLALEAWRDFGPEDDLGFRLVTRAGTALVLEENGPSARLIGQLGVGARMSLDPRIALLTDVRGELRVRPPDVSVEGVSTGLEIAGGLVMSIGLELRLD